MSNILSRYLDKEGKTDYEKASLFKEVSQSVADLKVFDLEDLKTRDEKIAFWVNTYNLLAIYGVLSQIREKPDFTKDGLKGIKRKVGFFTRKKYAIAGDHYSLNRIENQILRNELQEPRVHFALVCGASSCPVLKDGLYSGDTLDSQLSIAATLFINSPKGVSLDKDNGLIRISKIFKWYRKDFGGNKSSVLNYIARYHDEGAYIKKNGDSLKIVYLEYDWGYAESKNNKRPS